MPRIIPAFVPSWVTVGEFEGSLAVAHSWFDLRQPEVQHLDRAIASDLDVGGLEVAMDDALLVRRVQGIGDLSCVAERGVERQRALRRLSVHELHHEVVGTDVVQRADVGVVQRRDGPRFAFESIAEVLT